MRSAKKLLALVLALVLTMGLALPAMATGIGDFRDSAATDAYLKDKGGLANTYANAVQFLIDLGVLVGNNADPAKSDLDLAAELSRIQFMVLLYKVMNGGLGIDDPANTAGLQYVLTTSKFDDMENHWGKPYANWAFMTGVSAGDGTGKFNPEAKLSLMDALLFCMKAIGLRPDTMYEPGYAYDMRAIYTIASTLYNDKDRDFSLMDNVVDLPGGNVDRGAACMLFYNLLYLGEIEYSLINGVRSVDQEKCLLVTKFGYVQARGTIFSDGNWIALNNEALPANGGARISNIGYPTYYTGSLAGSLPSSLELTPEATATLGLDVDDVGRTITFMYNRKRTTGQGEYTTVFPKFEYTDKVFETLNGVPGSAGDNYDKTFEEFAKNALGQNFRRDKAHLYVDYARLTNAAGTNFDGVSGGPFEYGDACDEGNRIRIIYDGSNYSWGDFGIRYVFVEVYKVIRYKEVGDDGGVQIVKLTDSAGGSWPAAATKDSKKPANILGLPSDIKANDVLMVTYLQNNKSKVIPVTETVTGVLTSYRADNKASVLGGKNYSLSPLPAASMIITDMGTSLGSEHTYYLWNGKVVFYVGPPGASARPNDFAVVTATAAEAAGANFGGLDGTEWNYYANMLLADSTRKSFVVEAVHATVWNSGANRFDIGASLPLRAWGTPRVLEVNTGTTALPTWVELADAMVTYTIKDDGKLVIYLLDNLVGDDRLHSTDNTGKGNTLVGTTGASYNKFPLGWFRAGVDRYVLNTTVTFVKDDSGPSTRWIAYTGTKLPRTDTTGIAATYMKSYLNCALSGAESNNNADTGNNAQAIKAMFLTTDGPSDVNAPNNDGTRYAYILSTPWHSLFDTRVGVVRAMLDDGTIVELETTAGYGFSGTVNHTSPLTFGGLRAWDIIRYEELGGKVAANVQKVRGMNWKNPQGGFTRYVMTGFNHGATNTFTVKVDTGVALETVIDYNANNIKIMVLHKSDGGYLNESKCTALTPAQAAALGVNTSWNAREVLWDNTNQVLFINADGANSLPAPPPSADLVLPLTSAGSVTTVAGGNGGESIQWQHSNNQTLFDAIYDYNFLIIEVGGAVAVDVSSGELTFIVNGGGDIGGYKNVVLEKTDVANTSAGVYYVDMIDVRAALLLLGINPETAFGWGVQLLLRVDGGGALTELDLVDVRFAQSNVLATAGEISLQ